MKNLLKFTEKLDLITLYVKKFYKNDSFNFNYMESHKYVYITTKFLIFTKKKKSTRRLYQKVLNPVFRKYWRLLGEIPI